MFEDDEINSLLHVRTVQDWYTIRQAQRRGEEMSLEEQIEELTRTLAELQKKARLRAELKELYDLPHGAVITFSQKFPRSEITYDYAAVKTVDEVTGDSWSITGSSKSAPHGQGTERLIAWLDHAVKVAVLMPQAKTLRGDGRPEGL